MARKARKSSSSSFRLNAPTQMVFAISLILAVLGLIGLFVPGVPVLGAYYFWCMVAAYVVLAAGNTMKGL